MKCLNNKGKKKDVFIGENFYPIKIVLLVVIVNIEHFTFDMERNANEYSELFYHCVQVLNEYNDNVSEEIFLEEYFQLNKVFICFGFLFEIKEFIILGA
jgi:hypothetical protein